MFGNHEYRLKALESNDAIYSQRIPAINKTLTQHGAEINMVDKKANEATAEIANLKTYIGEMQHELNSAHKRINQLYDVIGAMTDKIKELETAANIAAAFVRNSESVYAQVDKRLVNLGHAVGQQEIELAGVIDFVNIIKTTGITLRVADAAVENDDILE